MLKTKNDIILAKLVQKKKNGRIYFQGTEEGYKSYVLVESMHEKTDGGLPIWNLIVKV